MRGVAPILLLVAVVSVSSFMLGSNFASISSSSSSSALSKSSCSRDSESSPPVSPCPSVIFPPPRKNSNNRNNNQNSKHVGNKNSNNEEEENDSHNSSPGEGRGGGNEEDEGVVESSSSSSTSSIGLPSRKSISQCVDRVLRSADAYVKFADQSATIRRERGPLKIAAFSRLWVPPLHGTGGMQFHAMHLYSQLAVKGHKVHVFVTGPPHSQRDLYYEIDPQTHAATIIKDAAAGNDKKKNAAMVVHQVASSEDGEYTVKWFENCLTRLKEINSSLVAASSSSSSDSGGGGFDVIHSESWAGVANLYQIGLPAAVTWHGSMLDWFRNEVNLIVHNFRMRGKMTGEHTANRMKELGGSVAYEAYMLLSVPDHIVISDSAASDLRRVNLIDPESVHVIYNGVNTRNFRPAPTDEIRREEMRKSFLERVAKFDLSKDYQKDLFIIGCGGRLDGIKGHHQLSVAMKSLFKNNNKGGETKGTKKGGRRRSVAERTILLVAGRGTESRRYEALRSQGFKVYLLGMLNQQNLAEFYQTLDVFVDPFYQHHGLNTVMLEAALSQTAIVVTDLASAETTVPCNGGFGLTFPLGEPEALADKLAWLAQHPTERASMAKSGRERALKLFSSSVMAARYEHLLYEAVQNPKPLLPIVGKIVCRHAYPKMCYRQPSLLEQDNNNNNNNNNKGTAAAAGGGGGDHPNVHHHHKRRKQSS